MAILNSSGAIVAKAKAKYGKRLKYEDYKRLLDCRTVAEVVSYLKTETSYKDVLVKVNENSVHRGQVEAILRQKLLYDIDSLCRYDMSGGSRFSAFIVEGYEVEQIIHFLTLLSANRQRSVVLSVPTYFTSHCDIDFNALAKAQSFADFADALSTSPYGEILREFTPKSGESINIPEIEDALYTYVYKQLYDAIDSTSSNDKTELKRMFDNIINFQNFVRILRMKKYYNENPQYILKHLLPFGSISQKNLEAMCCAEDTDEVFGIMQSIPQGKGLDRMRYNYPGEISKRAKFNISRNKLYFSSSPSVVLISYVYLRQTELANIINIIEGARYSIEKSQVEQLLIYK